MSAEDSLPNSEDDDDDETLMPTESNVIGSDDDGDSQEDYGAAGGEEEDDAMPVDADKEEKESAPQKVDSGLRIFSRGKRFKVWESNVVRSHERPVPVASGEALAAMRYSGTKSAWPQIEPADIVVLKGDINDSEKEGAFVEGYIWYVRAVVEGSSPAMTAIDASMLIHVPKSVTTALVQLMSKEQRLQNSSLLKKYIPFNDNSKALQPVGSNDWEADSSTFDSAEVRETKKRKPNDAASATEPATSSTPAASGSGSGSVGIKESKESKRSKIDMTPMAPKKKDAPKKINMPAQSASKSTTNKMNPVFAASKQPKATVKEAGVVPDQIDPVVTLTGGRTHSGEREVKKPVRHVLPTSSCPVGPSESTSTWTGTQVPGAELPDEHCFVIPSTAKKWRISVTLMHDE